MQPVHVPCSSLGICLLSSITSCHRPKIMRLTFRIHHYTPSSHLPLAILSCLFFSTASLMPSRARKVALFIMSLRSTLRLFSSPHFRFFSHRTFEYYCLPGWGFPGATCAIGCWAIGCWAIGCWAIGCWLCCVVTRLAASPDSLALLPSACSPNAS